jgi:hypothetical protein
MTTYGDMLYMLGGVPVGSALGDVALAGGNWYFCDPTHGNAQGDALTPQSANSDLLTCYNLTRDGYNDGVVFIGGATAWNPSAMLTWSNSYCHLIGTSGQLGVGNRCRIVSTSTAALTVPVTFSGDGCVIKNLQINNEGATGSARGCAIITGQRCIFENVFFMVPTSVTAASYSCKLSGGENSFIRCTFGQHTLLRSAADYGLWVHLGAGDNQRNKFIGCDFLSWSNTTDHVLVKIATDLTTDTFTMFFEDCLFCNLISGAGTLTAAIVDGATDAGHRLVFKGKGNVVVGCTAVANPLTYSYTAEVGGTQSGLLATAINES